MCCMTRSASVQRMSSSSSPYSSKVFPFFMFSMNSMQIKTFRTHARFSPSVLITNTKDAVVGGVKLPVLLTSVLLYHSSEEQNLLIAQAGSHRSSLIVNLYTPLSGCILGWSLSFYPLVPSCRELFCSPLKLSLCPLLGHLQPPMKKG